MSRFFNTAGPCNKKKHYYLPVKERIGNITSLIDNEKYFIIHAPRQTGKTTMLLNLVEELNKAGKYTALYVNVETAQAARENVKAGIRAILQQFRISARITLENDRTFPQISEFLKSEPFIALQDMLSIWAHNSPKPLVIFIDEIDSLVGDTLISVLRQLRTGYNYRPKAFPQSIALIGVRDVRDYRIYSKEENAFVFGGSAFNIKAESLRLRNFNKDEVHQLYNQHTEETGQKFTDEAIERVYYLSQGQPWLVNALGDQVAFKDITDSSVTITASDIDKAKETLILRRDTHLDCLIDKLNEERVRRIIDPIIAGEEIYDKQPTDDIQYVIDLGLITERNRRLEIANPIYQEVLPRELSWVTQLGLSHETVWYQNSDGSLNMQRLLRAFQQFFRENSEIWLERFAYKESGPHILMMAFLQRIVNYGGNIEREYGLGRRRVDLCLHWKNKKYPIELKLMRGEKTKKEGVEQLSDYLDKIGEKHGYLIIFDRRTDISWEDKIYEEQIDNNGRKIIIFGC